MISAGRAFAPLFLAAGTTTTNNNQPGGQGQEFGSASPVALIVIILLFIAAAFLVWSMTKHLKKVPKSFDPEELAKIEEQEAGSAEKSAPTETESTSGSKPAAKSD